MVPGYQHCCLFTASGQPTVGTTLTSANFISLFQIEVNMIFAFEIKRALIDLHSASQASKSYKISNEKQLNSTAYLLKKITYNLTISD